MGVGRAAAAVRAGLRGAGVVHDLAVGPREPLGAGAQVLVGRGVLARAAVLARLVPPAVVEVWKQSKVPIQVDITDCVRDLAYYGVT